MLRVRNHADIYIKEEREEERSVIFHLSFLFRYEDYRGRNKRRRDARVEENCPDIFVRIKNVRILKKIVRTFLSELKLSEFD